jgi:hypothetical protein
MGKEKPQFGVTNDLLCHPLALFKTEDLEASHKQQHIFTINVVACDSRLDQHHSCYYNRNVTKEARQNKKRQRR